MQTDNTDETHEGDRIVDERGDAHLNQNDEPVEAWPDSQSPEDALADAKVQAAQYYKNWQRAAADFANYKRRVEQERSETARLASAALVLNLLPIYDDMDRAASNVDASLAGLNWVQGMLAIQRKFASLLESMGISEIAAEGQRFDPAHHEAIGQQPGEEGMVLHVAQKGYRLGDRVIRPAMVIVGDGNAGSPDTT